MNKKASKMKIDDKEDLEIRKVAYYKSSSQFLLLLVLIVLFGFTLFNSLMYIGKYYKNKETLDKGIETIEIRNSKNSVLILNDGILNKKLSNNDIDEEIMLTNYSTIELETNKDEDRDGTIVFDVKYDITENDFPSNIYASNDSDVKVRFAYSYDNENWTYINNVISTYETTLDSLVDSYYDISGVVSTLKVATNNELSSAPGEKKKIYWKSETLIKNSSENLDKNIKANFKIEYKESI